MTDDSTVNSQIVDSVSTLVTLSAGQAPAQALGMLDAVLLETLGMAMYNAVNRQQSASMIGSAAVTAACAKMLSVPFPVVPPPPPPPPGPPPVVRPLPPPPPEPAPPTAVIAAALAEGKTAVEVLKAQALGTSSDAATAMADLQSLHDMTAPAPAPAPAPVPVPVPVPTPVPAPVPVPVPIPVPTPAPVPVPAPQSPPPAA